MEEAFRTPVQTTEESSAPVLPTPVELVDEAPGKEEKRTTDTSVPFDVYEREQGKFLPNYFDVKNTAHVFPVKAELGYIDKYIKSEIALREMELTASNYEKILAEIEEELGTKDKERFKRINRIFNYIKVVSKYQEIKQKRDAYLKDSTASPRL